MRPRHESVLRASHKGTYAVLQTESVVVTELWHDHGPLKFLLVWYRISLAIRELRGRAPRICQRHAQPRAKESRSPIQAALFWSSCPKSSIP